MNSLAGLLKRKSGDGAASAPIEARRLVDRFVQESSNLWAENRILKLLGAACLVSVFLMSLIVAFQAANTRTIVVPMSGGSRDLLIVGDKPSPDYLSAIARDVVALSGTFTASTAEFQFNELLKFVHPSVYGKMREDWKKLVSGLKEYREVSFATYVLPQKPIEIFGDRIRVAAERTRFIGEKVGSETGVVEIRYVVENGRFWIKTVVFLPATEGAKK